MFPYSFFLFNPTGFFYYKDNIITLLYRDIRWFIHQVGYNFFGNLACLLINAELGRTLGWIFVSGNMGGTHTALSSDKEDTF
jgi:hypothetical protein